MNKASTEPSSGAFFRGERQPGRQVLAPGVGKNWKVFEQQPHLRGNWSFFSSLASARWWGVRPNSCAA